MYLTILVLLQGLSRIYSLEDDVVRESITGFEGSHDEDV
jgi:hypothetical protein